MRIFMDDNGKTIKEPDTAEDYLLLEIERLKAENKELQEQLNKNIFVWHLVGKSGKDGKYLMSFKDGKMIIEEQENE